MKLIKSVQKLLVINHFDDILAESIAIIDFEKIIISNATLIGSVNVLVVYYIFGQYYSTQVNNGFFDLAKG